MGKIRVKMAKTTDERIKSTDELIGAIKIVKMNCWESYPFKKINYFRENEIKLLQWRGTMFGWMQGQELKKFLFFSGGKIKLC
jgi:hypothetical protein